MLTITKRQEYLLYLGIYKGSIDGIEGIKTKRAYKDLQDKYFFRKEDKDGKYGKNTEKLLISVYNVKKNSKDFDIKKDKMYCRCKGKFCTGYPSIIDIDLIKNLQLIRNKFGKTIVTSLLRCKEWNKKSGGVNNSKHTRGKAVDFKNINTITLNKRKEVINYWFTLNNPSYSYCNGYYRNRNKSGIKNSKTMGISVHGDVL